MRNKEDALYLRFSRYGYDLKKKVPYYMYVYIHVS